MEVVKLNPGPGAAYVALTGMAGVVVISTTLPCLGRDVVVVFGAHKPTFGRTVVGRGEVLALASLADLGLTLGGVPLPEEGVLLFAGMAQMAVAGEAGVRVRRNAGKDSLSVLVANTALAATVLASLLGTAHPDRSPAIRTNL